MRSIVTKLWLAIALLVVSVLLVTGIFLSNLLSDFYFNSQADQLINKGQTVAGYLLTEKEADAIGKAQVLADEAKATIVIADPSGLVRGCSPGMGGRFNQGLRLQPDELTTLAQGKVVVRMGDSPYFNSKMLWVAVPAIKNQQLVKTIVLYAPVEPIVETTNELRNMIFIAAAGGVLLATVLALFLSKTLSRPLLEMNEVATKMIHGDFVAKVRVSSDDEVGKLGSTLNELSYELKSSLTALSYEKDQLKNILSSMTDGVISFSPEGIVTVVNPRATEILEQNQQAMVTGDNLDQSPIPELKNLFSEVLTSGLEKIQEVTLGIMTISVRMAPLRDQSDGIRGVVTVLQDITKERNLDKMRQDFVANVTHELRTPLCLMQGYGEALLDGLAEDPQQRTEMVGIIVDETKRMQRLVNDLLDLAKMEAKSIQLQKEPVDINQLLQKVAKKFEGLSRETQVSLNTQIAPTINGLFADYDRLEQIFTNLLDNAFRHTPAGGRVEVAAHQEGNRISVRIADSGSGIPAEELTYIWERFYKVDKSRNRKVAGTGLGLSIVKALVEAHGGKIAVHSREGQGTTFTMEFPLGEKG